MVLAVDGLDVTETEGEIAAKVSKLTLSSSKAALDSIARHLGMFKDKVEVSVDETLAERLTVRRYGNCAVTILKGKEAS